MHSRMGKGTQVDEFKGGHDFSVGELWGDS